MSDWLFGYFVGAITMLLLVAVGSIFLGPLKSKHAWSMMLSQCILFAIVWWFS